MSASARQSDDRVPGRGRGGPPPSFGRGTEPDETFTIRGGQALHVVMHVELTPDAASLAALHAAVRDATRAAVLDGYAAAFAEMDEPEPAGDTDTVPAGNAAADG